MTTARRTNRGLIAALAVACALVLALLPLAVRSATLGAATAEAAPAAAAYAPQVREYWIAADEVEWDYAPDGKNDITGEPFGDTENVFVANGQDRIGHKYIKSLYHEYTKNFAGQKAVDPNWKHLGYMGPLVRAVVGDTVIIHFKNNLPDRAASIHVHGFRYLKSSEGAPYDDGTSSNDAGVDNKGDDGVPPGGTWDYKYIVPASAGPGPMDGSSVMWMYHSHKDEVADDYSGLVGPIIVTKASMARPDGTPTDVDREFVVQYKVSDENASPYLAKNIATYTQSTEAALANDPDFGESNLMHTINGYVYGNMPVDWMTVKKGQRVRWYLSGMGTEVDLHTPHWHGNTVIANGMRTDVVSLLPMTMVTADMTAENSGTWLWHCHVNDHITAGMIGRYKVL